jgi:hypothetical protein
MVTLPKQKCACILKLAAGRFVLEAGAAHPLEAGTRRA